MKLLLGGLILGLILIFQSCKGKQADQENGYSNKEELISELKEIYYKDQKYRRIIGILSYRCPKDSLLNTVPSLDEETQLAIKVIYQAQAKLDDKNTEKLLKITKRQGFPGMEYLDHDIPIYMVFVHSKEKYWNEIRNLIKKEFNEKRISEFERDFIFWNLNRSKGMPPAIPFVD